MSLHVSLIQKFSAILNSSKTPADERRNVKTVVPSDFLQIGPDSRKLRSPGFRWHSDVFLLLHAASGVGFTCCKTLAEFPACCETVATTVSMERLSGVFRAACVKLPGPQMGDVEGKKHRDSMRL